MIWSPVTWWRMALIQEGNTRCARHCGSSFRSRSAPPSRAGGRNIVRFAKIKQISVGSGHPEVVPAEGKHSYGHARPSGEPDFDSAFRGGPALLVP